MNDVKMVESMENRGNLIYRRKSVSLSRFICWELVPFCACLIALFIIMFQLRPDKLLEGVVLLILLLILTFSFGYGVFQFNPFFEIYENGVSKPFYYTPSKIISWNEIQHYIEEYYPKTKLLKTIIIRTKTNERIKYSQSKHDNFNNIDILRTHLVKHNITK